jgi:transcriptional regulator with XRE-family HTH domain
MENVMKNNIELKDILKDLLDKKNISQAQLSVLSGVSRSNLSEIINGKVRNPGKDTIGNIAKALDVPIGYLYKDDSITESNDSNPELKRLKSDFENEFKLIKKIKDNEIDLKVVESYIDFLISQKDKKI